jgi:DNA recombination protein RmuC
MELLVAIIIGLLLFGGLIFVQRRLHTLAQQKVEILALKDRLEHTTKEVNETLDRVGDRITGRLDKVTEQVGIRLSENAKAINESKSFLTERVEHTERTVRDVTSALARLQEASEKMVSTNQEILHFQQMLKVPKVRGGFGEILLENLLKDCLPEGYYEMQYHFQSSSEIADAVIRLMDDHIVVVDSKFPLTNYEATVSAENDEEKKAAYRAFLTDVKKHIKDISDKYISPTEHTLDYAFMYIPMEGIYYEMVVRRVESSDELWNYSQKHKVIPVSPNSFLSYLHTLLLGFRGMRIEKQAKEIVQYIAQVRKDFMKFEEEFSLLGGHIVHAKNKYEDTAKRLDRFHDRLEKIEIPDASSALSSPSLTENNTI